MLERKDKAKTMHRRTVCVSEVTTMLLVLTANNPWSPTLEQPEAPETSILLLPMRTRAQQLLGAVAAVLDLDRNRKKGNNDSDIATTHAPHVRS